MGEGQLIAFLIRRMHMITEQVICQTIMFTYLECVLHEIKTRSVLLQRTDSIM